MATDLEQRQAKGLLFSLGANYRDRRHERRIRPYEQRGNRLIGIGTVLITVSLSFIIVGATGLFHHDDFTHQ